MKKIIILITCLLFSINTLAAKKYSKEEIQKIYVNYLSEEGFRPKIDDDGDIKFKFQRESFYLFIDDNDEEYIRLALPAWKFDSNDEEELRLMLATANFVNRKLKVIKITIEDSMIWIAVEMFVDDQKEIKIFFNRMLNLINLGKEAFKEFCDRNRKIKTNNKYESL